VAGNPDAAGCIGAVSMCANWASGTTGAVSAIAADAAGLAIEVTAGGATHTSVTADTAKPRHRSGT
jgi:hypothetical protein